MTSYRILAETLEAAADSRGKLEKIARLSEALVRVDDAELPAAARLLSGSPFAEHEQSVTSVGWASVVRAATARPSRKSRPSSAAWPRRRSRRSAATPWRRSSDAPRPSRRSTC